jgi:hypothetical protein
MPRLKVICDQVLLPAQPPPFVPLSHQRDPRRRQQTNRYQPGSAAAAFAVGAMICGACDEGVDTCGDCTGCGALCQVDACIFNIGGQRASVQNVTDATMLVSAAVPIDQMNIVLNLMGGSYSSDTNFSAHARRIHLGCFDIDNAMDSGGCLADITANTVFSLCCHLNTAKRVAAVVASQRCSSGALIRFRECEGDSCPQVVRSIDEPDGKRICRPSIVARFTSHS